ncbi:MAG: hypothetical protein H5T86_06510 [Armatimonadetes bacterium]|nr:hypothetical protein [Armatimonadota bacterium]
MGALAHSGRGGEDPRLTIDPLRRLRAVAAYVRERTQPTEFVQGCWVAPIPFSFLADRPNATRFGVIYGVVQTAGYLPELHRAYVEEFLRGVEARKPSYLVLREREVERINAIKPIEAYIRQHYALEANIGRHLILRRRAGQQPKAGGSHSGAIRSLSGGASNRSPSESG